MSCLPEWNLLKWIRREIKLLLKDTVPVDYQSIQTEKVLNSIIVTMNDNFSDWPEDPK